METIMITLSYSGSESIDLKIPAFMEVGEFIRIICGVLNTQGSLLQAEPLGIVLDVNQSFADQQVEHGALLTLHV